MYLSYILEFGSAGPRFRMIYF